MGVILKTKLKMRLKYNTDLTTVLKSRKVKQYKDRLCAHKH